MMKFDFPFHCALCLCLCLSLSLSLCLSLSLSLFVSLSLSFNPSLLLPSLSPHCPAVAVQHICVVSVSYCMYVKAEEEERFISPCRNNFYLPLSKVSKKPISCPLSPPPPTPSRPISRNVCFLNAKNVQ